MEVGDRRGQAADHLSRSGHFPTLFQSQTTSPPNSPNLHKTGRLFFAPRIYSSSVFGLYTYFTMAAPGQPSPQQMAAMQQQFAAEAAKRGLTPEQFAQKQREQLTADAAKLGLSPEQYVAQLRMRALQAHQKQMEAQQQGQGAPQQGQPQGQSPAAQQGQPQQQTHQVPVQPGQPPDPKALAVANFLRSQNLKPRTCILDGQRKDMFKGVLRSKARN